MDSSMSISQAPAAGAGKPMLALLGLYKVLAPAEGDFTDAEAAAMDMAREVLIAAGVDLDALEREHV